MKIVTLVRQNVMHLELSNYITLITRSMLLDLSLYLVSLDKDQMVFQIGLGMRRVLNSKDQYQGITLPFKMFGPFWSVWCKMALAEVGVSLP